MSSTSGTPPFRTCRPGPRCPRRPWQTVPMAQITLRGNPINTVGELPSVGSPAPAFSLTGADMGAVSNEQFSGKPVVLNIFPSVDTPVCATSVRTFNERVAGGGVTVVNVSKDLPFAQTRFCGAEGIENVTTASAFRDSFGEDYGVSIADGPITGPGRRCHWRRRKRRIHGTGARDRARAQLRRGAGGGGLTTRRQLFAARYGLPL